MKLFITRHGETDWNVQEKVCGISEAQLTENGRQQAQLLAQQLERDKDKNNIGAIYVSPLKRARETASYIEQALHIQAVVEKRIQEVNFGSFEGKNWKSDEFLKIRNSPFMKFPGGESLTSAAARSYSFIEENCKKIYSRRPSRSFRYGSSREHCKQYGQCVGETGKKRFICVPRFNQRHNVNVF